MKKSCTIIIGLGSPGLFLLREIVKVDKNIVAIGKKNDIGQYSKFGDKYVAESLEKLKNTIQEISKTHIIKRTYIASGYYLNLILKDKELYESLNLVSNDYDDMKLLINKSFLSDYLTNINLNIKSLESFSIYQFEENIDNFKKYPYIIKWNGSKTSDKVPKIKIINCKEEFLSFYDKINSSYINNELIIQKYINIKKQYSYGAFYLNGIEQISIIVEQIRQYPKGVSSYVCESNEKKINRKLTSFSKKILKKFNYQGFIELEYIISENNNIYVIDINPRTWGWISIFSKRYQNFSKIFEFQKPKRIEGKQVKWVDVFRDIVSNLKLLNKEKNIYKLLKRYKVYFNGNIFFNNLSYYYDPIPIIGIIKKAFKG